MKKVFDLTPRSNSASDRGATCPRITKNNPKEIANIAVSFYNGCNKVSSGRRSKLLAASLFSMNKNLAVTDSGSRLVAMVF